MQVQCTCEGTNVAHLKGHYVAQVRMVFRPVMTYAEGLLPLSYAYIEPLEPTQVSAVDKAVGMICLKRCFLANRHRESRIVRLLDIWRPVEVVPVFGKSCPDTWDSV